MICAIVLWYYESEMSFIKKCFLNWVGEGKLGFSIGMCVKAIEKEFKKEISDYYTTIFSRKAGPPICIALCILTIISFALTHW